MRRLTTRQRFAFIFSGYFFVMLVILCVIFLTIFSVATSFQLKKELLAESSDIINNHLVISKESVIFKKDEEGSSLKEYLITHNISAIFLDSNEKIIRTYGLFAIVAKIQEKNYLMQLVTTLSGKENYIEKTVFWNKQMFKSFIILLKTNNKVVGYMIIGKSLEEINNTLRIMVTLFISLVILNLIGSFIVGYLLVRWVFMPLRKMIKVIENIEYDNLDSLLPSEGNSADELTHLSGKFNDMLSRLNDMAQRQKSFIANASHELKTPLSRAILSLDLLNQDSPDSKRETKLIREDLFEINDLIERLLLLTRLKKDIHMDKPRDVLLEDFFEKLKKRFEPQLKNKKLNLFISSPKRVQMLIPYEYLSIIFSNLLLNSIKYSLTQKNIFINASLEDNEILISVKDEGVGMNKDELKRIFDRFYRGKGTRQKGYGIGLSLVKQICDLYNIKISVFSEKEKGTTVSLRFCP